MDPNTDPAVGSSHDRVSGNRDNLLETKLHLPAPPPGFVARSRLVDQLDEGLTRRLTLVSAPAGFGKTAQVAAWCRQRDLPVAWLSLDDGDNDPVRFWRHASAALDRLEPRVGSALAPALDASGSSSFEDAATVVINALSAEPTTKILVLDDYHLIESETVHSSLGFLIEHGPPEFRLVVLTRSDPPLPLARLRGRGQLSELRAEQLRFEADEATALVREAFGVELDDAAVATLTERTEGWAVGLHLAGLALKGHPDVADFVDKFNGSHRYVLDYLTQEVLDGQPTSLRRFLLETSVLDRLSGDLCDAVTCRGGSQAMLEEIERSNLFLVPLDEVRGWWRYHQLFADLLRARIRHLEPDRMPQLHRSAALWHEEHGPVDEAVRHALAADDQDWAARLIERHFDALYLASEGATLQRWLAELPAALVHRRPRLLLAKVGLALRAGVVDEVEEWLDTAEEAVPDATEEPYEPTVGPGASRLANIPAVIAAARAFIWQFRGDPTETVSLSRQALAILGDDEWLMSAIANTTLGGAEWLRGRLDAADCAFTSVIQGPAAGEADMAALSVGHLGQIQRARGRLDRATETYRRALEPGSPDSPVKPVMGVAHVGLAEVAYQKGDLDTAEEHLAEGLRLCRRFAYAQTLADGMATLAWVRHVRNEGGSKSAMREAQGVADPVVADLLNPVPASAAKLSLAQGKVAAAARWTAERGLSADDMPGYPQEPAYLVLARLLLARDEPDRALALLDRLHVDARDQGRCGSVIEIQALRALALAAAREADAGDGALSDALVLGAPQGYVRVFADEGAPMADMIGRMVESRQAENANVPLGFLGRLVAAFEQRDADDDSPAVAADLVVQLTDREGEVLVELAAGKSNKEIGDELFMALNTVKKHVTQILQKLGAGNRTEATARARELGLLD